jgi:DNA-binding response OmpR family regulator
VKNGKNIRILVVDDDDVSLGIIKKVLTSHGFETTCFDSAEDALSEYDPGLYDLILSDYFMPIMTGDEFLKNIRKRDDETPFVFLTANTDVKIAIELVKSGADDHIVKPIVAEELVFRVNKNLKEKENLRIIEAAETEKALLDLEKQKLVNWRSLYASKDINQTEQMISLLSRTINQSGGFLWLDLLKSQSVDPEDGLYRLDKDLVEMIVTSVESQKSIFDYITFISRLDDLDLEQETMSADSFIRTINGFIKAEMSRFSKKYPRTYMTFAPKDSVPRSVSLDITYMKKIMYELLANAVKFSPPETRIMVGYDVETDAGKDVLQISFRNAPVEAQQRDREGKPIRGIPYDYSELVFDLFYTIEGYPVYLEEEEWSDGTGLYVCRKLLKRQNGWIKAANGVDYTGDHPETFVKITVTVPYSRT